MALDGTLLVLKQHRTWATPVVVGGTTRSH